MSMNDANDRSVNAMFRTIAHMITGRTSSTDASTVIRVVAFLATNRGSGSSLAGSKSSPRNDRSASTSPSTHSRSYRFAATSIRSSVSSLAFWIRWSDAPDLSVARSRAIIFFCDVSPSYSSPYAKHSLSNSSSLKLRPSIRKSSSFTTFTVGILFSLFGLCVDFLWFVFPPS